MIRSALILFLPLVVPFVVWVIWMRVHRARRLKAGLDPNVAPEVPVIWLAVAGGILMVLAVGLLYFYSEQGAPAGTPYVPAPDQGVDLNAWPVDPGKIGERGDVPQTGPVQRSK